MRQCVPVDAHQSQDLVQGLKKKKPKCDAAAHWEVKDEDRGVEGGAAFSVYSSETVSPGSHFGSNVSQQALTFRYYAQLSKANKHDCGPGHLDWKAGAVNHLGFE